MKPEYWFIAILGAALTYELYAAFSIGRVPTISQLVWKWSEHPLVPFIAGMVAGHFFWTRG